MTGDRRTTQALTTDRRRIGAWENEGGHLAAGSPATVRWIRALPLSDLPDESAIHVDLAGVPVCVARSNGTVHALLDECSHGQVALSEGDVGDGVVECWLHGSCFDLVTGVPTGPPALTAVPVFPVRVLDDVVQVAVPAPAPDQARPPTTQETPCPRTATPSTGPSSTLPASP